MTLLDNKLRTVVACILGVTAFVVYCLTLSAGAYPGESAALVTQYSGLFIRMSPPHPIWGAIVWLVSKLPIGALATRLNLLSALFGAIAVVLMYQVMSLAIHACVDITDRNRGRAAIASHLGGIVSAVSMAFCIPFWMVSTRAHNAAFNVVLLLVCARLLLSFALSGRPRTAVLLAILYGCGIVEFATLIIMAPLFGGIVLYVMWRYEDLRPAKIVRILAAGLCGMLLYLAPAWWFYDSPGYYLREFKNFWHIIWIIWRDQYLVIVHSLPRQGWLLVLVLTIIPWLTMLTVARRALNGEKDWAFYILQAVFTALALATLFNIAVAPWPMLGMRRLLVTPYVLTASLFGYVVAYWFLMPSNVMPFFANEEPSARLRVTECLLTIPLLACAAVLPFMNFRYVDGRQTACVNRAAREIVAGIEGRSWLVTDGSLDDLLLIAAHEQNIPMNLISLMWDGTEPLMKHVASMFEEPRIRNRASIGMLPLLREWCATDGDVTDKIALFGNPDVLASCGLTPLPHKLVLFGGSTLGAVDADALIELHRRFWENNAALLQGNEPADEFLAPFCRHVRRHAGLLANNLGVLMEDLGQNDYAVEAYRKAREIDQENISALLNLHSMVRREVLPDDDGAIQKQLEALAESLGRKRLRIWSLSRDYGYVRTPGAFVDMGWYWAASGQPGLAASGLRKAMELLPDDERGPLKQALADVYLMHDQPEESEALFYELLVENPRNQRALLGMARIEIMRGNHAKAADYLKQAEDAGVPEQLMAMEWATLEVVTGRNDEAIERLEKLLADNPRALRAWALLTGIFIQQNDVEHLAESIRRIESLRMGPSVVLAVARGHLAILNNDLPGARQAFEEASRLDQGNVRVREWLLKLDVIQGRESDARSHLDEILQLDPDNALANRILGTLQYDDGDYKLAEDSLRRSLKARSDPETLNDLAWLLQESGLYEEAEKHVRSALALDIKNHNAWDTLGVILMKTGRYGTASKAFGQALSLSEDHVPTLLHTAELLILQDKRAEAVAVLDALSMRSTELTSVARQEIENLRRKLSNLR